VWYKMDWFTRGDWAILSADVSWIFVAVCREKKHLSATERE
jgi:hypothetical protein